MDKQQVILIRNTKTKALDSVKDQLDSQLKALLPNKSFGKIAQDVAVLTTFALMPAPVSTAVGFLQTVYL